MEGDRRGRFWSTRKFGGDGYVCFLDCGNGCTQLSKFIKWYIICQLQFSKAVKRGKQKEHDFVKQR